MTEILIHTADGGVTRLVQTDEALAEQILTSIQPTHLFSQQHLIVVANGAIHSFPTSAVMQIDVFADRPLDIPLPENVLRMRAVSQEEFRESFPSKELPAIGDPIQIFFEFVLPRGVPQFVEAHLRRPQELPSGAIDIDMSLGLQRRLSSSAFFFYRQGGITILNSAHLLRLSIYPAPPMTPAGVWVAELA
jgi:hypothetical protein